MAALTLREPLTIRHVAGLKGILDVFLMNEEGNLDLDLSAVEAMDGLGYQCLLAFQIQAGQRGKTVRLVQVPPKLVKRLELTRTRLPVLPQEGSSTETARG